MVLEKDLWVVWALREAFELNAPDLPMAFKGGTSLSKAYGAVTRFSEDLDVTLGLLGKSGRTPRELAALSNRKRERAIEDLKLEAHALVHERLLPHLQATADRLGPSVRVAIEGDRADLKLAVHYSSVLPAGTAYIQRRVLLEFGGKNQIEPRQTRLIRTYLAEDPDVSRELRLPEATVEVLDAERTFWEKLTAVHVACQQPDKIRRLVAFSRHLLDLHLLMAGGIGPSALENTVVRDDVIETKTVLFREAGVSYDHCRTGNTRLVPTGEILLALENDYQRMGDSGMFGTERVPFREVLGTLQALEDRLNAR